MTEIARDTKDAEAVFGSAVPYRIASGSVLGHAIVTLTADASIASWNPIATNIFGYPADEMIGRPFSALFRVEDVAAETPAA